MTGSLLSTFEPPGAVAPTVGQLDEKLGMLLVDGDHILREWCISVWGEMASTCSWRCSTSIASMWAGLGREEPG